MARNTVLEVTAKRVLRTVSHLEGLCQKRGIATDCFQKASAAYRASVHKVVGTEDTLPRGAGRSSKLWQVKQFRRRCYYLQSIVEAKKLAAQKATERCQNKLNALSMIRAGLSDPGCSARGVEELANDFNLAAIGRTSVCRIRHAFARILLFLGRIEARKYVADNVHGFVCFRHLHDEACMRMKSFSSGVADPALGVPHRSRMTKVQNNSCTLHTNCESERPWLTALQPLETKDSDTLCHAILTVLQDFVAAVDGKDDETMFPLAGNQRPRLVHILVHDSVYANTAAAKKLWRHMNMDRRNRQWDYRLIAIRCASHQANLAVRTAITMRGGTSAA